MREDDGVPWLPVEVKSGGMELGPNWKHFAPLVPCKLGLQLVRRPVWNAHDFGDKRVVVAGAAEALRYFA